MDGRWGCLLYGRNGQSSHTRSMIPSQQILKTPKIELPGLLVDACDIIAAQVERHLYITLSLFKDTRCDTTTICSSWGPKCQSQISPFV